MPLCHACTCAHHCDARQHMPGMTMQAGRHNAVLLGPLKGIKRKPGPACPMRCTVFAGPKEMGQGERSAPELKLPLDTNL